MKVRDDGSALGTSSATTPSVVTPAPGTVTTYRWSFATVAISASRTRASSRSASGSRTTSRVRPGHARSPGSTLRSETTPATGDAIFACPSATSAEATTCAAASRCASAAATAASPSATDAFADSQSASAASASSGVTVRLCTSDCIRWWRNVAWCRRASACAFAWVARCPAATAPSTACCAWALRATRSRSSSTTSGVPTFTGAPGRRATSSTCADTWAEIATTLRDRTVPTASSNTSTSCRAARAVRCGGGSPRGAGSRPGPILDPLRNAPVAHRTTAPTPASSARPPSVCFQRLAMARLPARRLRGARSARTVVVFANVGPGREARSRSMGRRKGL